MVDDKFYDKIHDQDYCMMDEIFMVDDKNHDQDLLYDG
jgi:hypothetical protein